MKYVTGTENDTLVSAESSFYTSHKSCFLRILGPCSKANGPNETRKPVATRPGSRNGRDYLIITV